MNRGVLAVWVNAAPEAEADFDDWYTAEHLPERVDVPGFLSGARYRAVSGDRRYLAWYETENVEVLRSAAYLERLNSPTAWTRRVMPSFRDTIRAVFHIRARQGRGRGGVAATVRLAAAAGTEGPAAEWLQREALPGLAGIRGIVGAQLWTPADGGEAGTTETELRGPDATCPLAVLVEGTDVGPVRHACREWLSAARLRSAGLAGPARVGMYRLLYALAAR